MILPVDLTTYYAFELGERRLVILALPMIQLVTNDGDWRIARGGEN
jgi:hypothetical protein